MQIAVTILHLIFLNIADCHCVAPVRQTCRIVGFYCRRCWDFFWKNKGRTIDAILGKYTAVAAIGFLITSVVLQLIINSNKTIEKGNCIIAVSFFAFVAFLCLSFCL